MSSVVETGFRFFWNNLKMADVGRSSKRHVLPAQLFVLNWNTQCVDHKPLCNIKVCVFRSYKCCVDYTQCTRLYTYVLHYILCGITQSMSNYYTVQCQIYTGQKKLHGHRPWRLASLTNIRYDIVRWWTNEYTHLPIASLLGFALCRCLQLSSSLRAIFTLSLPLMDHIMWPNLGHPAEREDICQGQCWLNTCDVFPDLYGL